MYTFVRWLSLALFVGAFLQLAACEQPTTDPGAPFMAPPNGCDAVLDTRHAGDPPIKADSPSEGEDADDCPANDTGGDAGPPNDGDVPMDDAETPDMGEPLPEECPDIAGMYCQLDDCSFEVVPNLACGYECGIYVYTTLEGVMMAIDECNIPFCSDDPSQQECIP